MLYNMQYEYIIYSLTAILVTYTQQTFTLMQQYNTNCVYLYNYRIIFLYKTSFFRLQKTCIMYVCISYRLVKVFKRLAASNTGPFSSATSVILLDYRIRFLGFQKLVGFGSKKKAKSDLKTFKRGINI